MKAVRIHRFGGPEVLSLDTVEAPSPNGQQALIRVHAASVNPVDYKVRNGGYPAVPAAALPKILGRDVAGEVIAVGPDQSELRCGDQILAHLGWDRGGYAEQVLVEPGEWALKPDKLSYVQAAAMTLVGDTAWQGLFDQGKLKSGQRVLILGATGGVGQMAVQLAHQAGAYVFATGNSGDGAFLSSIGADRLINYKETPFERVASDLDLVLDLIGGETRARSWALLKTSGVLVTTVGDSGFADEAHRAGRLGRSYAVQCKGQDLAQMAQRMAKGLLQVEITKTFPLNQAAAAQEMLEAGHPHGKIVLTV